MESEKLSVEQCKEYFRELFHIELEECDTLSHFYGLDNEIKESDVSSGTFGKVFVVRYIDENNNDQIYAAKIGVRNYETIGNIEREREVIAKIRDNKVEGFPMYIQEKIGKDKYIFLQELCEPVRCVFNKNFNSKEENKSINPEKLIEVKKLGLDILKSFKGLEKINRIHRDVKTGNIVARKRLNDNKDIDYQYLLCDLGSVSNDLEVYSAGTIPLGYTPEYTPKSAMNTLHYMYKDWDTHGLGVSMYELLMGKMPYKVEGDRRYPKELKKIPQIENLYTMCDLKEYHYIIYTILKAISEDPDDRYKDLDSMITDLSGKGEYYITEQIHRITNSEPDDNDVKTKEIKENDENDTLAIEEEKTKIMKPMGQEDLIQNVQAKNGSNLSEDMKEYISDDSIDIFGNHNDQWEEIPDNGKKIPEELKNFLVDDTIDIFDYSVNESSGNSEINHFKQLHDWINDDSTDIFDHNQHSSDGSKGDISIPKDLVDWINDDSIDIFAERNDVGGNSTEIAHKSKKKRSKIKKYIVRFTIIVICIVGFKVGIDNYKKLINGIKTIFGNSHNDSFENYYSQSNENQNTVDGITDVANTEFQEDLSVNLDYDDKGEIADKNVADSDIAVDDPQYDEIGKEVEFGVHVVDYSVSPIKRDYIKWIILGKEGNNVLLVSKDVLFIQPYNETIEEVSWEDSSLNQLLQTGIFSNNEYKKLVNPNEDTDNDENRVFILDKEQIKKYLGDDIIIANVPESILNSDVERDGTSCAYWVRDDKYSGIAKPIVTADGELQEGSVTDVNRKDIGVRPAIYLKEEFVNELLQSEYYWQIDPQSTYHTFVKDDRFTLLTEDFVSKDPLSTYGDDLVYVLLYEDKLHTNDNRSYDRIYHYAVFKKQE